jgi:hypothetical protein
MSIKKTIIEKLVKGMSDEDKAAMKAMFAEVEAPEAPEVDDSEEVAMADATLEDGTTIRYEGDTPTEGARVVLVDEEGNEVPAPDGDHALEGGVTISVAGGVITAVSGAPEEAPAEEEMDAEPKDDKVADLEAEVSRLKDELAGTAEAMSKVGQLTEDMATLVGVVSEFMAAPATEEEKPADVKATQESIKDVRAAFRNDLRELNRAATKPAGKMAKKFQKFADMERKGEETGEDKTPGPVNENAMDRRLAELERKFASNN